MKKIVLFFFLFLTSFLGRSQETTLELKPSALLWKIDGPNVQSPCYLFGTIHLIDKDVFFFPKKLDKTIRSSEQIVMEIGEINRTDAMKHIMLDSGSFFDYFSAEQEDTIFLWAKTEMKLDEDKFRASMDKMKPFAVVQMAVQMSIKKPFESYEMTISSMAKSEKIPTIGLETVAQQLGYFDKMSKDDMAEFVMGSIRDYSKGDSIKAKMQEVYLSQNLDDLHYFITTSGGSVEDKQKELIDDRNFAWVPKIEELISQKSTFIAVGAGHLGGINGLIRLLERKGYTLKPVKL